MACIAQATLAIDSSVVNVANATIGRELHIPLGELQWTVTAYTLTFGGFLLVGGRLADAFSHLSRWLLIGGLLGFGLASVGCGAAQSSVELVIARLVQGLFAALLSPALLALLANTFEDGRERRRALAAWAVAGSAGAILGFFLGGVITAELGWRWIFFINVPVVALSIFGCLTFPRGGPRDSGERDLNLASAALITGGIGVFILGLSQSQTDGWADLRTQLPLELGAAMLVAFGLLEVRSSHPLIDPAVLRRREAFGYLLGVLQNMVGMATLFLVPLYLQNVWGYSALRAGLATLPLPIGFAIAARLTPRIIERFGFRVPITIGFVMMGAATLGLSTLPLLPAYVLAVFPFLLTRSLGQGLVVVPTIGMITAGQSGRQGVSAGLFNTAQQLGLSIGLAALSAVASATAHGSSVTGEAHGTRVAFVVCAVASGVAALLGYLTVPKPGRAGGPHRPDHDALELAADEALAALE